MRCFICLKVFIRLNGVAGINFVSSTLFPVVSIAAIFLLLPFLFYIEYLVNKYMISKENRI